MVKARAEIATRNAPIVVGRDAMVRVFVTPAAAFVAREIVGRLTITTGAAHTDFLATLKPLGASAETKLETTFDFDVPGSALAETSELAVRLEDKAGTATSTGSTDGARWPSTGIAKIGAASSHGNLAVVLVPFRYKPDASDRLPDTSPPNVKKIFDGVAALYPVPAVDVTVHAPVDIGAAIERTGKGWDTWLTQLTTLRASEAPKSNVVYVGVVTPTDTLEAFCGAGCVLSLSPKASAADPASLVSVSAVFPPTTSDGGVPSNPDIDVFNLAHAMGPPLGRVRVGGVHRCAGGAGGLGHL